MIEGKITQIEDLVRRGMSIREAIKYVQTSTNSRMTLEHFLDMQQELDDRIMIEKLKVEPNNENHRKLLNRELLALMVEVAELSNSLKTFKYWSNKPGEPMERVIEEYVDVLFFWLSIVNALEFSTQDIEEAYKAKYRENIKRIEGGY